MVSVIIVNYNTFDITSNCIRSVIEHTKGVAYEIVLVDNASTTRNADDFLKIYPSIKLIKSNKNVGFAGGNNLGIKQAAGDYFLLLNSDTILTEDSISKTLTAAKTHPDWGVVGCKMTFPNGKLQYTARKFRSISWELLDLFRFLLWVLPTDNRASLMLGRYFKHDKNMSVDWLNGAFFMFSKSVLQLLPQQQLDDRFFMYGEDVLWCEQIKNLGYSNYFFAGTTIIHINSASTSSKKILQLKKVMLQHELAIMKWRKGSGLYYFVFSIIFSAKENARYYIKRFVSLLTGKSIA
jgi:GT2 family glycosyltransferase